MKKNFKIIYLFAAAASFFTACKKSELTEYVQDPRVYFVNGQVAEYSFGVKPASLVTDTLYISLRIMGSAANRDRTFNLVLDDSSTAKLGYHFSFGPLVVQADSFQRTLPVYLYRKPGLKDSIVTAFLTIGESADFKPGYADKYTTVSVLDKQHYRIILNDQLLKPSNWETSLATNFGTYSKVKFEFMIQATGKTNWLGAIYPQDMLFLVQTVKYALYTYEQENGPLIDENGARVVFP